MSSFKMCIRLYVSETFETNSRSNAIYQKTLRTFVPIYALTSIN